MAFLSNKARFASIAALAASATLALPAAAEARSQISPYVEVQQVLDFDLSDNDAFGDDVVTSMVLAGSSSGIAQTASSWSRASAGSTVIRGRWRRSSRPPRCSKGAARAAAWASLPPESPSYFLPRFGISIPISRISSCISSQVSRLAAGFRSR